MSSTMAAQTSLPTPTTFSISKLPYELRQLIYEQYFNSLPALTIAPNTSEKTLHHLTPLSLASPFLTRDITPRIFYHNTLLSFSCPQTLIKFSQLQERSTNTRRIQIQYGEITSHFVTPDWVFLVLSKFEKVEELVFVVKIGREKGDCDLLGIWWKCVVDAAREGMGLKGGRMVVRIVDEEGVALGEKSLRRP